ncbi:hypothetical protein [Holdemanella biformis]
MQSNQNEVTSERIKRIKKRLCSKENIQRHLNNNMLSTDAQARSDFYNVVDGFFKQLSNREEYETILDNFTDDEIARLLFYSVEKDSKLPSHKNDIINPKIEYIFSNLLDLKDIDISEYINMQEQESDEFESDSSEYYISLLLLGYFEFIKFIYPDSLLIQRVFPPLEPQLEFEETPFLQCLLNIEFESRFILDAERYIRNQDLAVLLHLVCNASNDVVKIVENYCDFICFNMQLDNFFSSLNSELDNLINRYNYLLGKSTEYDNLTLFEKTNYLTAYNFKRNRTNIFESFQFLCVNDEKKDILNFSQNVDLNVKKNRLNYYTEGFKTSDKTFYNNEIELNKFIEHLKYFENNQDIAIDCEDDEDYAYIIKCRNEITRGLPTIYLKLNDVNHSFEIKKILYHEFFVLKKEHQKYLIDGETKGHNKSILKSQTDKCIKRINDVIDHRLKGKNMDFFDPNEHEEIKNERQLELYKLSLLLSEKIRKGYYREHGLQAQYKEVFDISLKLRKFFCEIMRVRNIYSQINFIKSFYEDLNTILNEMSISMCINEASV